MRVLILGASGRTGKYVLNETLKLGYYVNALVRKPESIHLKNDKVSLFTGNPLNIDDVEGSLEDCTAIISVLNISRNSDFPWSKLRTSSTFLSNVANNIIDLSKNRSLNRVVICSAWGTNETFKDIPFWFKWIINKSNVGVAYKGHERQENLWMTSNLNWTIIRPVGLTNSSLEKEVMESYQNVPKPRLTISRNSVAKYMVKALTNPGLLNKAVVISASKY
jgi:putative NADH-flavin reductase